MLVTIRPPRTWNNQSNSSVVPAKAGTHDHGWCSIDMLVVMGPGSRPLGGLGRDDKLGVVVSADYRAGIE